MNCWHQSSCIILCSCKGTKFILKCSGQQRTRKYKSNNYRSTFQMMEEVIPSPTNEIIQRERAEYNLDEQSINQAIAIIKQWLELQPHLPQENDNERLERWLLRSKNSVEKVKKSLDLYYSLKCDDMMCGWDTTSDWFRTATSFLYSFVMPQLTPDFDRIIVFGYLPKDPSEFDPLSVFKMVLAMMEIRMCEDYNISDIAISDLQHFGFGHLQKITFPLVKKVVTCFVSGYNARLKQIHFVNVNQYGVKFIGLLKLMLKPKLASRFHVHGKDMTSLHEFVPKNLLPAELGGDCGPLEQYWDRWKMKFESYRDWFLDHEKYKSDESKRPGGEKLSSEMFGFEGSFRKLAVD